ncbi:MAG TPA: hypothetical protein VD978_17875 [Azospirillum sp.]|nr:hypothetical protein [Azospirillum sp.]
MKKLGVLATAALGVAMVAMPQPAHAGRDACNFVQKFIDEDDTKRGEVNENIDRRRFDNLKQLIDARRFKENDNVRDLRACVKEELEENKNGGAPTAIP